MQYEHGCHFIDLWVRNFEIRIGKNSDFEDNEVCYKRSDYFDEFQVNVTCSHVLNGNWVSINKTIAPGTNEYLTLGEVRVFGRIYDGKQYL